MMPPASTALPIDADIDQLMRSLSDSVDTSHVSNEDIDKLLGSINVNFPSDMVIPGSSASNGRRLVEILALI
ncbi:hypothetical protein H4S06_002073 [Coemansia sp. BCRC 34490]|nr:hypothetical protein H4S06_002073 [Coemansia sp. BCRC 34490]